jgi:hypothetical protein
MAVLSMSNQEFTRLDVLLWVQSGQLRVEDACALIGLGRRRRRLRRRIVCSGTVGGAGKGGPAALPSAVVVERATSRNGSDRNGQGAVAPSV